MRRYDIPSIEVRIFYDENVLTSSADANVDQQYIEEVQTIFGTISTVEYAKRKDSIKRILDFTQ